MVGKCFFAIVMEVYPGYQLFIDYSREVRSAGRKEDTKLFRNCIRQYYRIYFSDVLQ